MKRSKTHWKQETTNENISAFSFEDKKAYFKMKWRKEHISLFVVLGFILLAAIVLPFYFNIPWLVGLAPLTAFIEYGYQNNKMMIYVENGLYGKEDHQK